MIPPRFERGEGLTPSEQILREIADRSFLKLWTYPNTFREQNRELTDLIIVFGDDVILFSDKGGAYPAAEDEGVAWRRYYRSAIAESAQQLRTAENWIRRFPDRVFLDARLETALPIPIPPAERLRVHRICVAPAATTAASERGGLPGLAIAPGVAGDAQPYTVGQIAGCQGWVHVFDEDSMSVVLPALSTPMDFIAYLRAKEGLIAEGGLRSAASEKDLLAIYLRNERAFPQEGRPLVVAAGSWDDLAAHPQFIAAQALNRQGDLWDRYIERLTAAIVEGHAVAGNEIATEQLERVLRRLAMEDRFQRRVISRAILNRAEAAVGGAIGSIVPSQTDPTLAYALLIKDHDIREPYAEYRRFRAMELQLRCQAAAVAAPDRDTIIGIGLDAANGRGGSEDFIYLDAASATPQQRAAWAEMRRELGYYVDGNVQQNRLVEDEYPDV